MTDQPEREADQPRAAWLDVADEPHARLVAALAAAQAAFPTIAKTKTANVQGKDGKQGYSYGYADLGDVLAAVRPILAEYGLAIVQRTVREGAKVNLSTELHHVGGAVLTSDVEVGQASGNPQQFGGALTYLRRYELVTLLGIAAEEDTDAQHVDATPAAGSGYGQPPAAPAWAKPAGDDDKRIVVDVLEPLVGNRHRAGEYAAALARVTDGFPVAVAKWLRALHDFQAAALRDEETAAAPAQAEAAAQDKAAEQPDTPAELDKDAPLNPDELEPAPESVPFAGNAADVQRTQAEPPDLDGPAPGSVTAPDLDGLDADGKVAALRTAGCVCPDPLTTKDVELEDTCPIVGHGIAF